MLKILFSSAMALTAAGVASSALAQSSPPPGRPLPNEVQRHVDAAYLLANGDINPGYLPTLMGGITNPDQPTPLSQLRSTSEPIAVKAFDELYYVGGAGEGAWALDTSDGIILFDAMNNAGDAENIVVPGLRKLGLDPARIKYLVIMHGHGDHYGGAKFIQETYGAKVLMGAADWDMVARLPATRSGRALPPPPRRDPGSDVEDGQVLKLGDAEVALFVTPGHTPATLSAIFKAKDHGESRVIGFWGGNGMPTTLEATAASGGLLVYREQLMRFTRLAIDAGVDSVISNHPVVDGTVSKAEVVREAGDVSPWVIGASGFIRFMGSNIAAMDAGIAAVKSGIYPAS